MSLTYNQLLANQPHNCTALWAGDTAGITHPHY